MRRVVSLIVATAAVFSTMTAVAAAKPGDLLVADYDAAAIVRIDPNTGAQSLIAQTPVLDNAADLALLPNGDLLVSTENNPTRGIYRVTPAGAVSQLVGASSGLEDPYGIGLAPDRRLIFVDYSFGIGPSGGLFALPSAAGAPLQTLSTSELTRNSLGLDVGPDGDAYLSNNNTDQLLRFDIETGAFVPVSSGGLLTSPFEVNLDPRGSALVSNTDNDLVIRVDLATGAQQQLVDFPPSEPTGIDTAPDGTIYVADFAGPIIKLLPNGTFSTVATGGNLQGPGNLIVEPPKCAGQFPTIVGSDAKDNLKGTKGADVIVAYGGKDRVVGRGGKDRLCGGRGKDTLIGGKGKDKLIGGKGKDKVKQ
jgi:hypothetical protein